MPKVSIIQTDNRLKLDYLLLTQQQNKKICDQFGYNYLFIEMNLEKNKGFRPEMQKIFLVHEYLKTTTDDILVFLDSDAWVQNGAWLQQLILFLENNNGKQGCFSRDPYVKKNTYVNSGSFLLKINEFTKNMYQEIISTVFAEDSTRHNTWPFDQIYISDFVFRNRNSFYVFVPSILNTPIGEILRHNWWKTPKMYYDLHQLINSSIVMNPPILNLESCLDNECYPNTAEHGYEYFH
jgi:glycosyltransferase involved in cell wall biosynthesis